MTRSGLEKILHQQIPLSRAMGIRVSRCSVKKGVEFTLPLKPNRNHKQTAFGGTLVAAQALVSWAWLMALLEEENVHAEVVVQRQIGEFLRPVKQNFKVCTEPVTQKARDRFFKILKRHGKARLSIAACALSGGKLAAQYVGEYVAISG